MTAEPEALDITRNISLDRSTDKVVLDKLAEMAQAGVRGISYSAAVRALLDELADFRAAANAKKAK